MFSVKTHLCTANLLKDLTAMPSRNQQKRELINKFGRSQRHKRTEGGTGSQTEKQLVQARKRARVEDLQSLSDTMTDTRNFAGEEQGYRKVHQSSRKMTSDLRSTMSGPDERSRDTSSDRDQSDFSASGSGHKDGTRGFGNKQQQQPKGKPSHSLNHWGSRQRRWDNRPAGNFGAWVFDDVPRNQYMPFSEAWPDPHMSDFSNNQWGGASGFGFPGLWSDNRMDLRAMMPFPQQQNWGSGGGHDQFQNQFQRNRNSNRNDSGSLLGVYRSGHASADKQKTNSDGKGNYGGRDGSRWNKFARQFKDTHFHREQLPSTGNSIQDPEVADSGICSGGGAGRASSAADSSGLDSSGSSSGRKRSHSMEGEKPKSKSSRAEQSQIVNSAVTSSSFKGSKIVRAFADLNGSLNQTPDSTSGKTKSLTSDAMSARDLMPCPAAVSTTKSSGPASKKKQFAESAKGLGSGVHPKSAEGGMSSKTRSGEGVLEKAERMCKELREKRKQAAQKRAAVSSEQGESLSNTLDDSVRSVESSQSSLRKGYQSDSNLPVSLSSRVSAGSKSSADTSVSSEHQNNVERIRRNIESSVLAECKTVRPRRTLEVQPAGITASRRSTPSSSVMVPSAVSGNTATDKPPRPQALSKDALAKLVNTPRSRTQRVQLARMLRLHTTTAARPRHARLNLQLDGLYDVACDNSVEDVLKDIGGLEELEGLGELRNVKLEDLSTEDKLRIAQLIEDVDNGSKGCDTNKDGDVVEIDLEDTSVELTGRLDTEISTDKQRTKKPDHKTTEKNQKLQPDTSAASTDFSGPVVIVEHPLSPQRLRSLSPNPNRPLSIDDLNFASQTVAFQEAEPVPMCRSPASVSSSPGKLPAASPPSLLLSTSLGGLPRTEALTQVTGLPSKDCATLLSDSTMPSDEDREQAQVQHHLSQITAGAEDTACLLGPLNILAFGANSNSEVSRQVGVLHEVLGLCQRQDSVLAEMRGIDVQLSQLYKSLIEIVARMSSLQRRRVQLQGEGEQLSQQRSSLLAGIIPSARTFTQEEAQLLEQGRHFNPSSLTAPVSVASSLASVSGLPDSGNVRSTVSAPVSQAGSVTSSLGSSVTLPSWLNTGSSCTPSLNREGSAVPSGSVLGSDVCLSGSISSSVRSETPTGCAGEEGSLRPGAAGNSMTSQLSGTLPSLPALSAQCEAPLAPKQPSAKEPRTMLSLGDINHDNTKSRNLAIGFSGSDRGVSSGFVVSEAGVGADTQKDIEPTESSSGLGSSITMRVSSTSSVQQSHNDVSQSDHSTLQHDSDRGSGASLSEARHSTRQDCSFRTSEALAKPAIDLFASPQPGSVVRGRSQSVELAKSPGVGVAYLGSIPSNTTSDLVQQIVRNLPAASQLGEMGSPRSMSMFLLKPVPDSFEKRSSSMEDISGDRLASAVFTDNLTSKTRTRSISLNSDVNNLVKVDSHDEGLADKYLPSKASSVVPRLNIPEEKELRMCTPRSESDANSIASTTSLGEQIKLLSERNSTTSSTTSFAFPKSEMDAEVINVDELSDGKYNSPVRGCSVVLQRLDLDNVLPELEKPKKKMKTKKDRNKVLQRRRQFTVESSSDPGSAAEDQTLPDRASVQQQLQFSRMPGSSIEDQELMEGSGQDSGDLDCTLVDDRKWGLATSEMAETNENKPVSSSDLGPNSVGHRLRLKTFHSNTHHSVTAAISEMTPDVGEAGDAERGSRTLMRTESNMMLANSCTITGPCTAVTGLEIVGDILYVCFQQHGIRSYNLSNSLDMKIYPVKAAQCFVVKPVGSRGQQHLAVGCEDRLTFVSLLDGKGAVSVVTEVKVMCLLAEESKLFAGLDCGAVLVISLMSMQVLQRYQASESSVHCMAWAREGSTRLLCVSTQSANIHIIDAGNGLPLRSLTGHSKTAFALCMSDDLVISGSGDRTVMAHDVHTAAQEWKLQDHKGIITSVCVDNGLLFSAGFDKLIHCYDLKSHKLLHLMYGAGKGSIMRMMIHNSVLYTGNRDGEVEALDLRDMGSYACGCSSCTKVFGIREHLWHHLVADHLLPNTRGLHCPWVGCSVVLNTESSLVRAGEHMRNHIETR